MPRFHFNVHDGVALPDDEGQVFETWEGARAAAIRSAGELLQDRSVRSAGGEEWHMEVTDEQGLVLFRFDFSITESAALAQPRAQGQAQGRGDAGGPS